MRRVVALVLSPVLLAIALIAWGVSSPVGSTPDEDFHLASIWCGLGDRAGLCEQAPSADDREVPAALASSVCFREEPLAGASCQDLSRLTLAPVHRVNATHIYPPLYYAAMGIFASSNIAASVITMRILNALIFVLLGVALYLLLPAARRAALVVSWTATLVPMATFLIPSVNPSGWTITGVATAWLAALGFFETRGRRRTGLAILAVVGAIMAAGSRADGAAYAILAVGAAGLLSLAQGREFWRPRKLWLPAAVLVVGAVGFVISRQSGDVVRGVGNSHASVPDSVTSTASALPANSGLSLLLHNLVNIPLLWTGNLGSWPLGWIDTPMPVIVSAVGVFVFGAVVIYGLRAMDWRKGAAMAIVVVALIVIPLLSLQQTHDPVGQGVQPRYILPLMVLLAGLALMPAGLRRVHFTVVQRVVIVVAVAISNAAALYANMARYVHAPTDGGFNLNHNVVWWWSGGLPSPMIVWLIGAVTFAAGLAIAVLRTPAPHPVIADSGAEPGADREAAVSA